MSDSPAYELMKFLLNQECQQLRAWLQKAFSGEIEVPIDFNWLGLAQATAAKIDIPERKTPLDLEWAKISLTIYDFLINQHPDFQGVKRPLENSAMRIRTAMILAYGNVENDYVLDSKIIIDWFFSHLNISLEEATETSRRWKSLCSEAAGGSEDSLDSRAREMIDTVREITFIKQRLSAIKPLVDAQIIRPDSQLKSWLELK